MIGTSGYSRLLRKLYGGRDKSIFENEREREALGKSDDVVILIMGPTGAGKSKFIKDCTGDEKIVIGHSMESCTHSVTPYQARVPDEYNSKMNGRRLLLVDTPGFDQEFVDDATTLRKIVAWLKRSRQTESTVAGIIYLSDITQKKTMVSWKSVDKTFAKILRVDSFSKVVFATTQWDKIKDDSHGLRQQERERAMQKHVVERSAKIFHIHQKPDHQLAIIKYLLDKFFTGDSKMAPMKMGMTVFGGLPGTQRITNTHIADGDNRSEPSLSNHGHFTPSLDDEAQPPPQGQELRQKKQAKTERQNGDLLILVTGATGGGKTAFISQYTGKDTIVAGSGVESGTPDVAFYGAQLPPDHSPELKGRRLILADIPGLDDTATDNETHQKISNALTHLTSTASIVGIIQIVDNTSEAIPETTTRNLEEVVKLCGSPSFNQVVLATLGSVPEIEEVQESQPPTYWAVEKGAKLVSIRQTPDDLHSIVNYLLSAYLTSLSRDLQSQSHVGQEVEQIQLEPRAMPTKPYQTAAVVQNNQEILPDQNQQVVAPTQHGQEGEPVRNEAVNLEKPTRTRKLGLTEEDHHSRFIGKSDDHVIIIMGAIGSGKSTFIRDYTGNTSVVVASDPFKPCTRQVSCYEARKPERWAAQLGTERLILVDTPGFDDLDQDKILRRVLVRLTELYNNNIVPIAGIVYLHDIAAAQKPEPVKTDFSLFLNVFGEKCFPMVVLATSQWDRLHSKGQGERQELEFQERHWTVPLRGGAKVMRIEKVPDREAIISCLLTVSHNEGGSEEGGDPKAPQNQQDLASQKSSQTTSKELLELEKAAAIAKESRKEKKDRQAAPKDVHAMGHVAPSQRAILSQLQSPLAFIRHL